ncbi:diguanylate cyclase [Chitinivorax sp. B]|uniref:sensor domain-containing diguanylate cyclase n=1 Tax=Chitinivorax sp. B TaxID=2502235 RepID=UPI0010F67F25|nr:diguanylate cyclase [Chitinivorax sp. B]
MVAPTLPTNETERLASLYQMHLLDTPADATFDRIVRLARQHFHVPMAFISLIDSERQWFKSTLGFKLRTWPRNQSFCGHTILQQQTLIIPDTLNDERFAKNPLVTGPPDIRFYAGHPLLNHEGYAVGTLALLDIVPRDLSLEELQSLHDLVDWVETELWVRDLAHTQRDLLAELDEIRRESYIDPMLRTWNHHAIEDILQREVAKASRDQRTLAAMLVNFDQFDVIRAQYDAAVAEAVLFEAADRIRHAIRSYDAIGHWQGAQFLVIFPSPGGERVKAIGEKVRNQLLSRPLEIDQSTIPLHASMGLVAVDFQHGQPTCNNILDKLQLALRQAQRTGPDQIIRIDLP